jgi:hypothetical protein
VINTGRTHWESQQEGEDFQTFVDSIPDQLANSKVRLCLLCL